ncbi:MAG: zinc ribbon domain-containing protein, partial [Eggerthellaceae bacterium]
MAFNETLAKIRQDKGITQEQLARSLYVTRQAVSRWETGETLPNIDMCKLIARELDVPISTLLEMPEACLCQSCGMTLSNPADRGCEKDGSASEDYCKYCYDQGSFTYDATMDELIESCAAFMAKKANISVDEAVSFMGALLPTLKRWNEIQANERTYGEEARMRYGDKAVDDANKRLMSLTDEEWNSREKLEGAIIDQLKIVMEAGSESP